MDVQTHKKLVKLARKKGFSKEDAEDLASEYILKCLEKPYNYKENVNVEKIFYSRFWLHYVVDTARYKSQKERKKFKPIVHDDIDFWSSIDNLMKLLKPKFQKYLVAYIVEELETYTVREKQKIINDFNELPVKLDFELPETIAHLKFEVNKTRNWKKVLKKKITEVLTNDILVYTNGEDVRIAHEDIETGFRRTTLTNQFGKFR